MFPLLSKLVLLLVCTLSSDSYTDSISGSANTSQLDQLFQNHNHTNGHWKLKLVHRDQLISTSTKLHDHRHRFHARMQRDMQRVAALTHRLSPTTSYEVENLGSSVVSGNSLGFYEYLVRVGVGSPPTYQYLAIDTGSDVIWVQCQPCNQCYNQADPVFNHTSSTSFTVVPCRSPVCDALFDDRHCHAGKCGYEIKYGDGSYTKGTLMLETLTFGQTVIQNMAIGCGHNNQGLFSVVAGLLGLGCGRMSFVNQLPQTGGAFSYCLASLDSSSPGWLSFGRNLGEAFPMGAAWAPLIHNPRAPSIYYVELLGLGVGGVQLPIFEDIFQLSESGDGGVIIDTGTAVTRLPTVAYEALRDAFTAETRNKNIPRAPRVSIFDTCYNLHGLGTVEFPVVSFYFSGGPILTLAFSGFLILVAVTYCLAFASSPSPLSIIGNIQQAGIQISFDEANGFVGFGPNLFNFIVKSRSYGIGYIHSSEANKPAIVHRNSDHICRVLDQQFKPLIADCGLQKLLTDAMVVSALKTSAAMGYLAPEYVTTGRFTEKSDLFAFGVIILQVLSSKLTLSDSMRLAVKSCKFEDFIDSNLKEKFSESEAAKLGKIALLCTHEDPENRPTIGTVIEEFTFAAPVMAKFLFS
ncbi:hypothetical protein Dsin_004670 [Dipteronia sinensis]|uniref:Peptidase A1 domain-containing protein n=1 Tax=Dipteronia sinensis TaxID=43782 RepID=A0AAE0AVT6_9ROSI|nr:hypothetical protein Dsin_004670 [Dipteronia sinensis]